jgi:hypothetical protein
MFKKKTKPQYSTTHPLPPSLFKIEGAFLLYSPSLREEKVRIAMLRLCETSGDAIPQSGRGGVSFLISPYLKELLFWSLEFGACLVLGACNLEFYFLPIVVCLLPSCFL